MSPRILGGQNGVGGGLNGRKVTCQVAQVSSGNVLSVTVEPDEAVFTDGFAEFFVNAPDLAPDPTTGQETITLQFTLVPEDTDISSISTTEDWNVKNNFNTDFGEVLAGRSIYVFDNSGAANHVSMSTEGVQNDNSRDLDAFRKFDFVQELFNQVVPRKRSVTNYTLMEEDGIFGVSVMSATQIFKQEFHVADNCDPASLNDMFGKIQQDYPDFPGNCQEDWFDRIMDQSLLVGAIENSIRANGSAGTHDDRINTCNNNTYTGDTGLFELHDNVVRPFVDGVISEAERYAGLSGSPQPTEDWISREGYEQNTSTDANGNARVAHGPGMSYSYGTKNTVDQYNNGLTAAGITMLSVSECAPLTKTQITALGPNWSNKYHGNIQQPGCSVSGTAGYRWPGVTKTEYDSTRGVGCFNPRVWAGIDCSGLVQRAVACGKNQTSNVVVTFNEIGDANPWTGAQRVIDMFSSGKKRNNDMYYFEAGQQLANVSKIYKGDLIRYTGDGHVGLVYSYKPFKYIKLPSVKVVTGYQVIHAYGGQRISNVDTERYLVPDDIPSAGDLKGEEIFARKVLITYHDVKKPKGFGRVKLWD